MSITAKVLKVTYHDDPKVKPVITFELRYPRPIHGEFMAHREFERNGRSSRAVPVKTMLKEVWRDPFVPDYIGSNQPGMQAGNEIMGFKRSLTKFLWRSTSRVACVTAWSMLKLGVHKQIPNRLLEPFSYIDVVITTCSMDNFFALRIHPDAEPHMQELALTMYYALEEYLHCNMAKKDRYHLPYVEEEDREEVVQYLIDNQMPTTEAEIIGTLIKLSVVRCARVSYRPFDGKGDIKSELARYWKLIESRPVHASPAGHQAFADTKGSVKRRRIVNGKRKTIVVHDDHYENEDKKGCLHAGWVQFRKTIPDEYVDTYKHSETMI